MRQIADWLEKLGMSEYAQRFAENGIEVEALPHLTDQDLKDIGVLLGHRRVMLAAIGKLTGAAPATPEPTARAEPKPQDTAERRQVTVMFSDLVGSTALSTRMDPEDLREVISAYQTCVAEIVRRSGGFVATYLGDGILVYFGYPQANEDDAERAVREGLELIAAVAGLKTRASLQTRVGIATGLVVVGDLIGSGDVQELVGKKRAKYCCDVGRRQMTAKAKWCCFPARPVLANRGSRPRSLTASRASPIRAFAIFARHNTLTARFIRSSAKWNVLPSSRIMTLSRRSSISSTRCWGGPRPPSRTPRCLPKCCRFPTKDAIQRLRWTRNSADKEHCKLSFHRSRPSHGKIRC